MLSSVPQAWGTFYRPVCVRVRSLWRRKCNGLDWNVSWWSHSAQNCSRNIEYGKTQIRYYWSYRSAFSAIAKLCSRLSTCQCKNVMWLVFVKTPWSRIAYVFFLAQHYHRICHQLNIYEMNSVDVFATSKSTGNTTGAATSIYSTIDWFYAKRSWTPQTSILHDNFCLSMIYSDNDVEKLSWYCLICYAHMNLNFTFFCQLFFST
jgi:hypothetical protein